jgi:ribosome-binding factor A
MDENNHKKPHNAAKYLNKRENKFTPTISFVDDEILKNKKEFNLIVQEEIKEDNMNNV